MSRQYKCIKISVLIVGLLNVGCSLSMMTIPHGEKTRSLYKTGNKKELSTLARTNLLTRLQDTSILLLEDKPFDFVQLLPDLQLCIASFVLPHCLDNLKKTCTFLHKNITFQTPLVWNVVCHSLRCVRQRKMPELLLKAHLCGQTDIKEKILSSYHYEDADYPYSYCTPNIEKIYCFFPFGNENSASVIAAQAARVQQLFPNSFCEQREGTMLMLAAYTGDKNVVGDIIKINKNSFTVDEINQSLLIAINREHSNVIHLLSQLASESLNMFFGAKYNGKKLCNFAFEAGRIKAFEALVIFYKKHLNDMDKDEKNQTYLDSLIASYGKDTLSDGSVRWNALYYNIVREQGGITTMKTETPQSEWCIVQ